MKIKFSFSKPSEAHTFWSWIYYQWSFVNIDKKREIGARFLGVEETRLYEIGNDYTVI